MDRFKKIWQSTIALLWLVVVLTFAAGALMEYNAKKGPNIDIYQSQLEKKLYQTEIEIEGLFNNANFLLNAVEGYLLEDTVFKYLNKPYTFIIYNDKDSIVYWNNNKALPFQSDIRYSNQNITEKYEMGESVYLKINRPYNFIIDGELYYYNLVALVPLYKHYSIKNNYLKSHFPLMSSDFSQYITVSAETTDYPIVSRGGEPLVFLKKNQGFHYRWYVLFSIILYLWSSISLFIIIYALARNIVRKGNVALGILFFVGAVIFVRLITIVFDFPAIAHNYPIFNYKISEIKDFYIYSLGDFLVDMAMLFFVAVFISREIINKYIKYYSYKQQLLFLTLGYNVVILGIVFIQFSLREIINSSYLSFDFDNFSQLEFFTFLGLWGIGLLSFSYFFISYRIFKLARNVKVNKHIKILAFGLVLLLINLLMYLLDFSLIDIFVVAVFSITHAILLSKFVINSKTSLSWVSIWLLFFAALLTLVLENANIDKDMRLRKSYVKQLAFERDLETEKSFDRLVPQILGDGLLKISLNNPLSPSPRRQVVDLITYRYLDNYFFGRYDYKVHVYTDKGNPYRGEKRDYEEIKELITNSYKTSSQYLQFYSNPEGSFSYVAKLPITHKQSLLGIIIIEFTPKKKFKKANIYVELLSRNKDRLENIFAQYTYAIYKYDERIATNGSLFNARLPYDLPRPRLGEYLIFNSPNNNYLLYRNELDGHNIAIVEIPKTSLFKNLSVFAYIFCFSVFLLIIGQLLNWIFKKITQKEFIYINFENSLKEQIQRGVLLVTLSSFIAIAIITIFYYSYEYTDYHRSRLLRKVTSTAKTAVWQIHENTDSVLVLPNARDLADIHKIDVNIYGLNGDLISSSEKIIFERRLMSKKMNAAAFLKMKQEQQSKVVQTEFINQFEYLAAYVPLKDKDGKTIAFLNLPYDLASNSNVGSQNVVKFLGALLNVYVLLLLLAGIAALIIARSVTNPLLVIVEKLDKVRLGQKNDPIEWTNQDEIGNLIERYNHMLKELEESTKQLARSQKESAWREMAKQVAHEIKNPLTPMKLNIQLLQRVVNTNPEKAQKMVNRVSKALIEQIDSLARIASEFSNFAKMPMANNENLYINELVQNVYALFSEEENMQIELKMMEEDFYVFADRTQIMRVLNNLLKNAVQAIPENQIGQIKIKVEKTINETILIKIQDNGVGIPPEQKDDIFVPNFTTKSSGTGIGLAMSKKIVEMAKGTISFQSKQGEGTVFIVELPLI